MRDGGGDGDILACSSFWVVAMTLGNSWMAGRNFSCRSQTLAGARQQAGVVLVLGMGTSTGRAYKRAGLAVTVRRGTGQAGAAESLPMRRWAIVVRLRQLRRVDGGRAKRGSIWIWGCCGREDVMAGICATAG